MNLAGSRKLLGLTIVALCGTVALAFGAFNESFSIFLGAIYTAFIGGNVGEHMATRQRGVALPPLPMLLGRAGAAVLRKGHAEPEPEPEDDSVEARLRAAGFDPAEVRAAMTGGRR